MIIGEILNRELTIDIGTNGIDPKKLTKAKEPKIDLFMSMRNVVGSFWLISTFVLQSTTELTESRQKPRMNSAKNGENINDILLMPICIPMRNTLATKA